MTQEEIKLQPHKIVNGVAILLTDKEIEAEKKQQDNLQAQANAGNIDAQNSIKASIEAQKKATVEKQKRS